MKMLKNTLIYFILILSFSITSVIYSYGAKDIIDDMKGEKIDLKIQQAKYIQFSEHTRKFNDTIKRDRDMLVTIIGVAQQNKETRRIPELTRVLNDYNIFLEDLDLLLVILDMKNMIKEDMLFDYYRAQKENHEKIKFGFSKRNEVYLATIDNLKDSQARSYEKDLLKNYRDFCTFDIGLLQINIDETGKFSNNKNQEQKNADWLKEMVQKEMMKNEKK